MSEQPSCTVSVLNNTNICPVVRRFRVIAKSGQIIACDRELNGGTPELPSTARLLLLLLLFLNFCSLFNCPQEYKTRGLKQEVRNKISTAARCPDLRQDKMTPE